MTKKTTFNNPDSQEREYVRLLLRYSKQLQADVNRVLLPRIDDIQVQYKVEARTDSWIDTLDALMAELARLALEAIGSVVTKLPGQFNAVSKFNEGQFKLVVKANTGLTLPPVMPGAPSSSLLGVNVFRSEPFLKPLAEGWISENTALIKSLPTRLHPELEGIVRRGVMNGQSVKDIKDQIKARYGVTDYRAKLIAQDQTLKLNADLTRYRLQSVGVKEYVWRSVQDSRVRPEHADRNGKTYSWDKGPSNGQHPGQEVRCRCRAEAIWDDKDDPEVKPAPPKKVDPITEKNGVSTFKDLDVYHGTSAKSAEQIVKRGFRVGTANAQGIGAYVTGSEAVAKQYGGSIVHSKLSGKFKTFETNFDMVHSNEVRDIIIEVLTEEGMSLKELKALLANKNAFFETAVDIIGEDPQIVNQAFPDADGIYLKGVNYISVFNPRQIKGAKILKGAK